MEQVQEGTAPFHIESIGHPCSTYYKIFGDLHNGHPPVVVLHGGPGSGHEYLLPFASLWHRHKLPVVFYDQIGCASSTHLRQTAGDKTFRTIELFIQQLESLLDTLHMRDNDGPGFHILGHSWGGILAFAFASRQPRGLRRLILASAPATFDLYTHCTRLCYQELPEEAQHAVAEATRTCDFQNQSYEDAEKLLLRTFWCRANPFPPKELEARMRHQADDRTVFTSMYGSNLLECTGSFHDWSCIPALLQIRATTLVYHGEFDLVREEAIAPLLENIPGVRKVTVANASHMAHLDNAEMQEKVLELVGDFLSPSTATPVEKRAV